MGRTYTNRYYSNEDSRREEGRERDKGREEGREREVMEGRREMEGGEKKDYQEIGIKRGREEERRE